MTSNEGDGNHAKESSNQNCLRPKEIVVDEMDYSELGKMLKDLNMEITSSIEEDRKTLKSRLFGEPNQSFSEEIKDELRKAVETYKDSKKNLLNLCSHLKRTIEHESFTTNMSEIAEKRFPQYREKLLSFSTRLQNMTDEFEIVVSGETSSGKSTFLNVLLGERILPSDHLHKTASLCRLRYSENRKIECISGDNSMDKTPLNVDSSEMRRRIDSINQGLLSKKTDDDPFTAIDVYWPISVLQENIVLIDTPGIGEFNALTKQVLEYIPNCAGYIFIVDSSNAGGVRDSGIRKLIQTIAVSTAKECHIRDLRNTIFVCNKWDKVKKKDRKRVLDDTKTKIGKYFGHLEDWQILRFNADLELRFREWKANPTDDFKMILESLNNLMIRTVEIRLGDIYRWLQNFVTEMRECIGTKMNAENLREDDLQPILNKAREELDIASKELEMCSEVDGMVGIQEKILLSELKDYLNEQFPILYGTNCSSKLSKVNEDGLALTADGLEDIMLEWADAETGQLKQASRMIECKCKELQDIFDSKVNKINNLRPGFNLIKGSDKGVSLLNTIKHRVRQIVTTVLRPISPFYRYLKEKAKNAVRRSNIVQITEMASEAEENLPLEDQLQTFITNFFTCHHKNRLTEFYNDTKCKLDSARQMITEMEKGLDTKTDKLAVFQKLQTELNKCTQYLQ